MNGYYGNTKSVSTSGELLVVECNEGCVLAEGKYLTCPIRNIWSFKEAKPKCEGQLLTFMYENLIQYTHKIYSFT